MTAQRPSFLITIDTEGDDLWSSPRSITTENSRFLPRFQALCDEFGLKPTYLTNFESASCPTFRALGKEVMRRNTGEVGMHLHAWNSPPHFELTDDDLHHHPYLIEYPDAVMRDKIAFMTQLLEETFGHKMVSHRAGRWAFDERYARILVDLGYRIDCSVTPGISWRSNLGDPTQSGGTDYRGFPDQQYFLDLDDIRRPGSSPLLEIPVTIRRNPSRLLHGARRLLPTRSLPARALERLVPECTWLRPNGRNIKAMLRLIEEMPDDPRPVEFMLHSSEFMPGGSPTFKTAESIEALYRDMRRLFSAAAVRFTGRTLKEHLETAAIPDVRSINRRVLAG